MTNPTALSELHAGLRACRLCLAAGHRIAPGPVFSSGPQPQVMLIGQAPGVTEAQVKRPFNAGSGRRLFQWLGEAGWDEAEFRASAYMTAVTKCYPGPNAGGKGDRVPSKEEQALCRPWLNREITLVNPHLILLIGGLAIKLLYPARTRLEDIIGTAVFLPPDVSIDRFAIDLAPWPVITTVEEVRRSATGGRFIVPLPHPSGASLWPNKPENQRLIRRAVDLLGAIREVNRL